MDINLCTHPLELLEVLPEERDGLLRPGHAQLDDAVLEQRLDLVPRNVVLALAQRLGLLRAVGRVGRVGHDAAADGRRGEVAALGVAVRGLAHAIRG